MSHQDDKDLQYAQKLQREFDKELKQLSSQQNIESFPIYDEANSVRSKRFLQNNQNRNDQNPLNETQNLVHPEWENVDPTPDVQALFSAFDNKFFQSKLKCVQLEWSKRMYSCAGICYSRKNRMGMSVIIRLSEPLLKLRSRKNLVETLLHEMIHAYLFVLNIREGNGGHGPNFTRIMTSINKTAGTNITVYHTFYDEVNLYKTHVWRCNGICQHRKPFMGYVRRTCNRAPGPNDNWWQQHLQTCGGYFKKISEPEPKRKGNGKSNKDVQRIDDKKWGIIKSSRSATKTSIVTLPQTRVIPSTVVRSEEPSRHIALNSIGSNLGNVVQFKDLNSSGTPSPPSKTRPIPTTGGSKLGSGITTGKRSSSSSIDVDSPPVKKVRNIWADKYLTTSTPNGKLKEKNTPKAVWKQIDDDIAFKEDHCTIITLSDDDDDDVHNTDEMKVLTKIENTKPKLTTEQRQTQIKKEILDVEGGDNSDIELIDDDFDDDLLNTSTNLGDTSIIDDLFGVDTLMADFAEINNVIMQDEENRNQPAKEIISCPICQVKMSRSELTDHLDGCQGITIKINRATKQSTSKQRKVFTKPKKEKSERELLLEAGYTTEVVERVLKEKQEEKLYNARILKEMNDEQGARVNQQNHTSVEQVSLPLSESTHRSDKFPCPICQIEFTQQEMNSHLDSCLL